MNLAERLQNLQEEKHSKLTIGAFFKFMRTAYQVNDSFENLAEILSTNSEIDWQELAKINLDVDNHQNNVTDASCNFDTKEERSKDNKSVQDLFSQTASDKETSSSCTSDGVTSSQPSVTSCNINIYEICNKDDSAQKSNSIGNSNNYLKTEYDIKDVTKAVDHACNKEAEISQSKQHLEESECGLAKVMRENLRDILHEGLLDSVLPYMVPKTTLSQPIIKKSTATADVRKSSSVGNVGENKTAASTHKDKDREKNKLNKKSLE